jgi:hypothetical protein
MYHAVAAVGEQDCAASTTLVGRVETIFELADLADLTDVSDQANRRLYEALLKAAAAPFLIRGGSVEPEESAIQNRFIFPG